MLNKKDVMKLMRSEGRPQDAFLLSGGEMTDCVIRSTLPTEDANIENVL